MTSSTVSMGTDDISFSTVAESSSHNFPFTQRQWGFLALPFELRLEIYQHLFSDSSSVSVNTTNHGIPSFLSDWDRTMLQVKSTINTAIFCTNKQVSEEARAVILNALHIHVNFFQRLPIEVVRRDESMYHSRIPLDVRQQLRSVTYQIHEPWDKIYSHPRQPVAPFPFYETPNLNRFIIRKRMEFNIAWLSNSARERITPKVYLALDAEERLAFWKKVGLTDCQKILRHVAESDSGTNWIRRLLLPETYADPTVITSPHRSSPKLPPTTSPGHHSSFGNDHKHQPQSTSLDPTGLGVPSGCAIIVEANIQLYLRNESGQKHMETLVIEVDVQRQTILSQRFLNGEETQRSDTLIAGLISCATSGQTMRELDYSNTIKPESQVALVSA